MSFTQAAQRRIKTGVYAPNYSVRVGSIEMVPDDTETLLKSCTVSYAVSEGSSEASISTSVPLAGFENAPVAVKIGYGPKLAPYFTGLLNAPDPDEAATSYEAVAYGPYKLMAGQKPPADLDYRGWSVDEAIADLVRRSRYRSGQVVILEGRAFTLQGDEAIFNLESTLAEIAATICETSGRVITDMPDGSRIVRMKPRPGSTAKAKAAYTPEHYKTFKARSPVRNLFSQVRVFRRGESGAMDFPPVVYPVEVESRSRPLPGSYYDVPDFLGTEDQADAEARETARLLSVGGFECEMTGIGANPDLAPHDTLRTEAVEWFFTGGRTKDPYEAAYSWQLDNTISATLDANGAQMALSGNGIRLYKRPLPKPSYVTDRRASPYAVVV